MFFKSSKALILLASLLIVFNSLELQASNETFLSKQKDNMQKLFAQANQIIGIEAIVAAGDDKVFYSRFGHAMLRFVKADGDFATDSVLSLVANEDVNNIQWTKGLFGGYGIFPLVNTLSEFWEEYVKIEKRPLQRYVILSTPKLRLQLIKTLKAWSDNPKLSGDYTFLQNNCVGALATLLEHAGFPAAPGVGPIIPKNFDEWLKPSLISPFPPLEVKNTATLFEQMSAALHISSQNIFLGQNWPFNSAEIIQGHFNDLQIKQMLIQLTQMPYAVRKTLVQQHHFGNGGATLEDVMIFRPLPNSFYSICTDINCAQDVLTQLPAIWSNQELRNAFRQDDFAYWRAFGSPTGADGNLLQENYDENPSQVQRRLQKFPDLVRYYQMLLKFFMLS